MYEYPYKKFDKGKILLYLYGGFHSPCTITLDMLRRIEVKKPDITIIKVNTSKYYDVKERFSISKLPAVVYLVDGNFKYKLTGSLNYQVVMNMIESSE